jgi:hypothetical protein
MFSAIGMSDLLLMTLSRFPLFSLRPAYHSDVNKTSGKREENVKLEKWVQI